MKHCLIAPPAGELFIIERQDVLYGKRATAATKITPYTIDHIFRHELIQANGYFEAKGLVYADEVGSFHVRFWNEGDNQNRDVHHQDALADLLRTEAEGLTRLASSDPDKNYEAKAAELVQLALALNSARQHTSELYPEEILHRAQGFKFRRLRNENVVTFEIDSGITRAQIKQAVVLDGDLLSEMISRIHAAIWPALRAYKHIHVHELQRLRVSGSIAPPSGLTVVDLAVSAGS